LGSGYGRAACEDEEREENKELTMRSDTDNMRRSATFHNRFRSRNPRRGLIHHVIKNKHGSIPHIANECDHGVHFRVDKLFFFVVAASCIGGAT